MTGDAAMMARRSGEPRHRCPNPGRQLLDSDMPLLHEYQLLGHVSHEHIGIAEWLLASSQPAAQMCHQFAVTRGAFLERVPVGGQPFGSFRSRHRNDVGDLGERHVEAAEHDNQPRGGELALAVAPIAVLGIDVGRDQQAHLVVEAQCFRRKA